MKILHVIISTEIGGAQKSLYRLILNDKQNDHTVISLTRIEKIGLKMIQDQFQIFSINMNGYFEFYKIFKLIYLMHKTKPDIIQTWMYDADLLAGTIAKLMGFKKIFWNIRSNNYVINKDISKRTTRLKAKVCSYLSKIIPLKIISNSRQSIDVHSTIGYDINKFLLIPNGFDTDIFKPIPKARIKIRRVLKIKDDEIVLGSIGRYDSTKGYFYLIDSLSALNKENIRFKVILIGNKINQGNKDLMKKIKENNLENRVFLLGEKNNIPYYLNAFDIFILSSNSEAFPNILGEAMSSAIPCISTDVGDVRSILGNYGFFVPTNNFIKMARAIKKVMSLSIETRAKIGLKCRERIEKNYSIYQTVKKYQSAYKC